MGRLVEGCASRERQPLRPGGRQSWPEIVRGATPEVSGSEGILVIVGIVVAIFSSVLIGVIIALIGLVAFGGFAKGKWY